MQGPVYQQVSCKVNRENSGINRILSIVVEEKYILQKTELYELLIILEQSVRVCVALFPHARYYI